MYSPKISIILSTYNGEAYLGDLLRSLSQQVHGFDSLVVRDDHSTDRTMTIVQDWAKATRIPLHWESGEQIGPAKSFFKALAMAPASDIYMFADQDDIWLPGKIFNAVKNLVLSSDGHPMLYASRVAIVDAQLQFMRFSPTPRRIGFTSAICENLFNGCTMAMNHALVRLLLRHLPDAMCMHDWWVYLVASGTGTVLFDGRPTVLYRQHATNVIGAGSASVVNKNRIVKVIAGPTHQRLQQISEFLDVYGNVLTSQAREDIHWISKYRNRFIARVTACITARITRQSRLENIGTRLTILFNRF